MMVFLVVVGVYIYVQLTKKTALTVSFLYNNNDIAYKTQNVFVYLQYVFQGHMKQRQSQIYNKSNKNNQFGKYIDDIQYTYIENTTTKYIKFLIIQVPIQSKDSKY